MSLAPLWQAGPVVVLHAFLALFALGLGAMQLLLTKGTQWHRAAGWIWVCTMAIVALSSFAIHDLRLIGPFSPIHLLSILVLHSLVHAIVTARRGEIDKHRRTMRSLFFLGLILTGSFTLLPGRVMHAVLFGP